MMKNLRNETIGDIAESGHTPSDVLFVGSENGRYRMTWEEFAEASDFEYQAGNGLTQVAPVIVYFRDGTYLERFDDDGCEGWKFRPGPDYRETDAYQPLPAEALRVYSGSSFWREHNTSAWS